MTKYEKFMNDFCDDDNEATLCIYFPSNNNGNKRVEKINVNLKELGVLTGLVNEIRNDFSKKIKEGDEIKQLEFVETNYSDLKYIDVSTSGGYNEFFYNPSLEFDLSNNSPISYKDLNCKRGDKIIVRILSGGIKKFDLYFYQSGNNILKKSKTIFGSGDIPQVLNVENLLIINPSELISVIDYSQEICIVKNPHAARPLHNLNRYFEQKARNIISDLVINSETINLSIGEVQMILKNSHRHTLKHFNDHRTHFLNFLKSNGVKILNENEEETDYDTITTLKILLSDINKKLYLESLATYIEKDPTSEIESKKLKK